MNSMVHASTSNSWPMIGRLVWKDVRRLTVFSVVMMGLAIAVQAMVVWVIRNSSNDFGEFGGYSFGILGGFAALFAAACASTSFAAEKEERTFNILQLLPVNGIQLSIGKLIAALGLSLAFFLVATVAATFWIPSWQKSGAAFLASFGVATIEYFAWCLLFSLVLRNPLNAALAGIFCASAATQFAVYLTSNGTSIDYASLQPYALAWKTRLTLASVVLGVSVWKATNWLSTSPNGSNQRERSASSTSDLVGLTSEYASSRWIAKTLRWISPTNWQGTFYRLSWQSVRENWKGVTLAYGLPIGFAVLLFALNPGTLPVGLILICLAGAFAGVAAFSSDMVRDQSSSSYLAIHGVSAGATWCSRIAPWLLMITLVHVLIAAGFLIYVATTAGAVYDAGQLPFLDRDNRFNRIPGRLSEAWLLSHTQFVILMSMFNLWVGSILCFSAGQFLSNVIRSRFLALIISAIVCIPLCIWLALMLLGEVPRWASVFPFIIAFAIAGKITFQQQLEEKNSLVKSITTCGLLGVVAMTMVAAVANYRAIEIPVVEVGLTEPDVKAFESAETQAKFEAIRVKFAAPLAQIEWPDFLLSTDYYRAVGRLTEEQVSKNNLTEFERELAKISKSSHDEWSIATTPLLSEIRGQTEQFVDSHRRQKEALIEAINFAYERLNLLESAPPLSFGKGKKQYPLSEAGGRQLLHLAFHRHISGGSPQDAWQCLQAISKLSRMENIVRSNAENWFSKDLDMYSEFSLCQNQSPELMAEAIDFVRENLLLTDWTRKLAYDRARMLNSVAASRESQHNTLLAKTNHFGWELLKQLPSEQQRSRRLIDLWTAFQERAIKTEKSVEGLRLRDRGNPLTTRDVDMEFDEFAKKYHEFLIRGPRTTMIRRQGSNSYFRDMTRYPEFMRPAHKSPSEIALLERKLAIVQMEIVKHKLENGSFPESIKLILDSFDDNLPVYYYPEGKPKTTVASLFNRRNFYSGGNQIPPNLPFVSSRPVVEFSKEEVDGFVFTSDLDLDRYPSHLDSPILVLPLDELEKYLPKERRVPDQIEN